MKRVYLDHNATTPMRREVRNLFHATLDRLGGNASSLHTSGREARQVIDSARERVAAALEVSEDEILFTSGGTESNNLALFGTLRHRGPGAGLVTTSIEHSSVLSPAEQLEREGHPVVRTAVDAQGRPDLEAIAQAAGDEALDSVVVSVSAANNEVGSTLALGELAEKLRATCGANQATLHTDAVQALGRIPLRLAEWGIDLATFSAHKLGGPPGIGLLYHRKGVRLEPLQRGGGQELELRPGTENVPGIAAAALAIELAVAEREEFAQRTRTLASTFCREVRVALPDACFLGPPIEDDDRLPNTVAFLLPGTDGRVLVTRLDLVGLEVSAGSACASGSLEPSHVLLAMGLDADRARAGLRISLGRTTTSEDIHSAVEILSRTFLVARKSC